jgi:hypothetical protein
MPLYRSAVNIEAHTNPILKSEARMNNSRKPQWRICSRSSWLRDMNTLFGLLDGKSNQIRGKTISTQMALGTSREDLAVGKVSSQRSQAVERQRRSSKMQYHSLLHSCLNNECVARFLKVNIFPDSSDMTRSPQVFVSSKPLPLEITPLLPLPCHELHIFRQEST